MKPGTDKKSDAEGEYSSELDRRGWWLKWGLIFGFWSVLGVLYGTQIYYENQNESGKTSLWLLLYWQLIGYWYGWLLFTPVILWLGKKFQFEINAWRLSAMIHAASFTVFFMAHSLWYVYLGTVINPYNLQQNYDGFWRYVGYRITHQFYIELAIYGMILGVGYAFDYYGRYRERELRASELESQLALSQLQVLKMQLHPHFLFNTLNGITGLVRNNKNKAAVEMLVGLGELLRYTLDSTEKQEVSLKEELEFLGLYLDIQQKRFSDRLEIRMDIAPDSLEENVPNMILQPLVENALRHGIAHMEKQGLIRIAAQREDGVLKLEIADNGPGLPENWRLENSEGIGLTNVHKRLYQTYGENYSLDLHNQKQGGAVVTIRIPCQGGDNEQL